MKRKKNALDVLDIWCVSIHLCFFWWIFIFLIEKFVVIFITKIYNLFLNLISDTAGPFTTEEEEEEEDDSDSEDDLPLKQLASRCNCKLGFQIKKKEY